MEIREGAPQILSASFLGVRSEVLQMCIRDRSKRMLIPEVKNVMSWKEALAFAKGLDVVLIPYELAQGMKETREILSAIQPGQSVGIFIGPEGGFEEEEEMCIRDSICSLSVSVRGCLS